MSRGDPFLLGAVEFLFGAPSPQGVRSVTERWRERPAEAARVLCLFLGAPGMPAAARAAAVSALADLKQGCVAGEVIPLLADPDATVRNLAGWTLGRIGDATLAGDIAPMLESPDWGTRRAAVLALNLLRAGSAGPL